MLGNRTLKRIMIAVGGGTVVLIGVAMIILPGPAIIVIPAGLSILAIEFAWARRLLNRSKEYVESAQKRLPPLPAWARPWAARFQRWKEKLHPTKNPEAKKSPVKLTTASL